MPVNIVASGELSVDKTAVVLENNGLEKAGLVNEINFVQKAGKINLVGNSGLNSALIKNLDTLKAAGFGIKIGSKLMER